MKTGITAVPGIPDFSEIFRRMAEGLNPFNKLPEAELLINKTSQLKETFISINQELSDTCDLPIKQRIPGKHFILMTDASFGSPGEHKWLRLIKAKKIQSKWKTCASMAFV